MVRKRNRQLLTFRHCFRMKPKANISICKIIMSFCYLFHLRKVKSKISRKMWNSTKLLKKQRCLIPSQPSRWLTRLQKLQKLHFKKEDLSILSKTISFSKREHWLVLSDRNGISRSHFHFKNQPTHSLNLYRFIPRTLINANIRKILRSVRESETQSVITINILWLGSLKIWFKLNRSKFRTKIEIRT